MLLYWQKKEVNERRIKEIQILEGKCQELQNNLYDAIAHITTYEARMTKDKKKSELTLVLILQDTSRMKTFISRGKV